MTYVKIEYQLIKAHYCREKHPLNVGDKVIVHWGGQMADEELTIAELFTGANLPGDPGVSVSVVTWDECQDRSVVAWFSELHFWAYGGMLFPDIYVDADDEELPCIGFETSTE